MPDNRSHRAVVDCVIDAAIEYRRLKNRGREAASSGLLAANIDVHHIIASKSRMTRLMEG